MEVVHIWKICTYTEVAHIYKVCATSVYAHIWKLCLYDRSAYIEDAHIRKICVYTEPMLIRNLRIYKIHTTPIDAHLLYHIYSVYAQLWYMCNCTYTKFVHIRKICADTEDMRRYRRYAHIWKLHIYGGWSCTKLVYILIYEICTYTIYAHNTSWAYREVVHIQKMCLSSIYTQLLICTYLLYMCNFYMCSYLPYTCNFCICTYTKVAHNFCNIHIRQSLDIYIFHICATSIYAKLSYMHIYKSCAYTKVAHNFCICATSVYVHIRRLCIYKRYVHIRKLCIYRSCTNFCICTTSINAHMEVVHIGKLGIHKSCATSGHCHIFILRKLRMTLVIHYKLGLCHRL